MKKCIVALLFVASLSSTSYAFDPPDLALVYTDADNHSPSACQIAIANLGWPATFVEDDTGTFLGYLTQAPDWDIIVVESFDGDAFCELVEGLNHFICGDYGAADFGLKLVLFTSAMDDCSNTDFWSTLGMAYVADIPEACSVYVWYDSDGIFSEPNSLTGPFAVDYGGPNDMGDKHHWSDSSNLYSGCEEIAGATETYEYGESVIGYQHQMYYTDDPVTNWYGPHLAATMNTDCMTDQALAAQLWENALYNIWYCDYAISVGSTSFGEIKAAFK